MFSVCPHLRGEGGTPARSRWGGTCPGYTPGQVRTERYPSQGTPAWGTPPPRPGHNGVGVYPSQGAPAQGTPRPGQDGGYPSQGGARLGYPPSSQVRTRYPLVGVPPGTGQHMEYLISGVRYASCVHARGLSCLFHNFTNCIMKSRRVLISTNLHFGIFSYFFPECVYFFPDK